METYTSPKLTAISEGFAWLISFRPTAGNNFYARLLAMCNRKEIDKGTVAVAIDSTGMYNFLYCMAWYLEQSRAMQLTVMIHEAGHLALQHLPRQITMVRRMGEKEFKRVLPLYGIAVDMAVNDIAVREFLDTRLREGDERFEECRVKFVWPEDCEYPRHKTVEQYLDMLIKDAETHQAPEPPKGLGEGGSGGGEPDEDEDETENREGRIRVVNGEPDEDEDGEGGGEGSEDKDDSGKEDEDGDGDGGGGGADTEEDDTEDEGEGGGEGAEGLPQWMKDALNKQHNQHEEWEKVLSGMSEGELDRLLTRTERDARRLVKEAIEQTKKSRGTIPGALKEYFEDLFDEPQVPWETVFKGQMKSVISPATALSMVQPNPALLHLLDDGIQPYPGETHDWTFHIVALIDTSGSVSAKEFKTFLSELQGMMTLNKGISIQLVMFDARIQHEVLLGGPNSNEDLEDRRDDVARHGRGGTDFSPPLRRVRGEDTESDWVSDAKKIEDRIPVANLVVFLTDGYAPIPLPELTPDCPLIWIISDSGTIHEKMGDRVIKLN